MDVPRMPTGLKVRGRRTWKAMAEGGMATEQVLLLEEVCRTADRLDELDELLRGKGSWFDLVEQAEGSGVGTVVIDRALSEVRQQQNVFKQMLVTVRQLAPGSVPQDRGSRGAYAKGPGSATVKDEVGAKRAARGDWRSA